jgi:NADH:ubiquinone oxidoreductase subunit
VFAVIISLLPLGLGYLAILRDPQRRAWADRMTQTKVCYDSVARSAARARAGAQHAWVHRRDAEPRQIRAQKHDWQEPRLPDA